MNRNPGNGREYIRQSTLPGGLVWTSMSWIIQCLFVCLLKLRNKKSIDQGSMNLAPTSTRVPHLDPSVEFRRMSPNEVVLCLLKMQQHYATDFSEAFAPHASRCVAVDSCGTRDSMKSKKKCSRPEHCKFTYLRGLMPEHERLRFRAT